MASATERLQLILEAQVRGTEEIQKLNAAMAKFDKSTADAGATSKKAGADFDGFADKLTNAIRNPLDAASQAAGGFVRSLGPMGAAIGGTVAVAAAAGAAIFNLAKAYGDLYEQQSNNAIRLGVSIHDYGLLARVSTEAGLAGDALVGTMRGLSRALAENSDEGRSAKDALRSIGVAATDSYGATRPMRDLLLEIADKLGAVQSPSERAAIAVKVLGRSGMEVLPLMNSQLREQIDLLEKTGAGWTKSSELLGAAADKMAEKFDRWWDSMVKSMKANAAAIAIAMTNSEAWYEFNRQRNGTANTTLDLTKSRSDSQNLASGGPGTFFAWLTPEQNSAIQRTQRTKDFRAMVGPSSLKDQLSTAQKDLRDAIEREDGESTIRYRQAVASLEAGIKAAEAAAREGTFTARGLKDPIRINSLLRPGERTSGMLGTFQGKNGPSLLRLGETANLGPLGIDQAVFQRNQANALARSQSATDFAARRTEASAFPGFELQAATTAAAIRIAGLQQAKTLGMDVFQAEMEHGRIMQDLDLQRLNIQRQKLSELRQQGASLFNALTAGGGGLASYGKGLLMGTGSTLFSNAFAQIGSGLSGKFTLPGQGTQANPNFLGKILAGTPFGMDPAATATNANTMATIANTAALTSMRFGGGMGGGAAMDAYKLLNGFGGGGWSGTGQQATDAYMAASGFGGNVGGPSLTSRIGAYAGLAAGGYGIYAGASQGGLRGGATAAASAAGMVAMLPMLSKTIAQAMPLLGPIGAAASMALAMVPLLMGDPKKKRAEQLQSEARSRYSEMPVGTDYATDIYGNKTDYNRRGELRPIVNLTINAIDSQGVGEAMRQAINEYPPLTTELRGAMFAS